MARAPIPTWYFALVVVRRGERFLLVKERTGEWYLPAGRVEPGETIGEAAIRETREEAGIEVKLDGILRIEHSMRDGGARVRVFYQGRPRDDRAPKTVPDQESEGAAWVTLEDLDKLPLRGDEVRQVLAYVWRNGAVAPLDVLTAEGATWD